MLRNKRKNNESEIKKAGLNKLDYSSNSESETDPEVVRLNENDKEDKSLSDIRKYNTPLLSEHNCKYKGEIACRKNSDCSDDFLVPNVPCSEIEFQYNTNLEYLDDRLLESEKEAENEKKLLNLNSDLEFQKATCVQNQLIIWEKLLEARIHSQKILNKSNQLPYSKLQCLSTYKEYSISAQQTKQNLEKLLETLMETKGELSMQFSKIKELHLKKITPKANLQEYDLIMKSNFEIFKSYRNSTLLKWEDRAKFVSSCNTRERKAPSVKLNIVQNINNHLIQLNDLIKQTQTIKNLKGYSKHNINDVTKGVISHAQIYDDTDFYHSQLRELIEHRTNSSTNTCELNIQFAELHKLRQKMKKKVDTKASKGRRIRYMVHNKLINFMGSKCSSNWTVESKSELYKSLFLA